MHVWVLVRWALAGDQVLGAFLDTGAMLDAVAIAHPQLRGRWLRTSDAEMRLRDPRADPLASYTLTRTEVA